MCKIRHALNVKPGSTFLHSTVTNQGPGFVFGWINVTPRQTLKELRENQNSRFESFFKLVKISKKNKES